MNATLHEDLCDDEFRNGRMMMLLQSSANDFRVLVTLSLDNNNISMTNRFRVDLYPRPVPSTSVSVEQ